VRVDYGPLFKQKGVALTVSWKHLLLANFARGKNFSQSFPCGFYVIAQIVLQDAVHALALTILLWMVSSRMTLPNALELAPIAKIIQITRVASIPF
jgi:hypothetical protein